jgi:hypothetical protein
MIEWFTTDILWFKTPPKVYIDWLHIWYAQILWWNNEWIKYKEWFRKWLLLIAYEVISEWEKIFWQDFKKIEWKRNISIDNNDIDSWEYMISKIWNNVLIGFWICYLCERL